MRSSKLATAALTVILALLVLSASIAVPILFRPFYYIQIDALRLPERTGWPEEVIREAYDEVLDFCVLGTPFGTGELSWSESGRSHFADVRVLFRADFLVLGVTAVSAALLLLLRRLHRLEFTAQWAEDRGFGRGCWPPVWYWRWALWRRWTSAGPLPSFMRSFFPAKTTGCLILPRMKSF